MEKFELDFDSLIKVVEPDTNRIPLKGNEHRIIRVAFDMVRFKDGDPEELWQVQSNDDGEFLVRTFDIGDEETTNIVTSDWKVMLDKKEENITIAYKNVPIKRIACKEYGTTCVEEVWTLRDTIYGKLNTDEEFAKHLVNSLPREKRATLSGLFSFAQGPAIEQDVNQWALAYINLEKKASAFDWLASKDILEESEEIFGEATKSGDEYKEYFGKELDEAEEGLDEINLEKKEEFFDDDDEEDESMEPGLLASDQWKLAFLDLGLIKDEDVEACPKCRKPREKCICPKCNVCAGGPGRCTCAGVPVSQKAAADAPLLSKRSMCGIDEQEAEDKEEELLEEAYHALEHSVEPGSEEAVDLSSLIYDVEAGSGDPSMLRRMIEKFENKEDAMEEDSEEEIQYVDESEGMPLSFREFMEPGEMEPEEELSFEEEEGSAVPGAERIDEILDEMRDIKHRLRRGDTPSEKKSPLRSRLYELKMELAEITESEFGAKKPTQLYHSKGFSKSEFLPTAEEYFEELEADDE